MTAEPLVRDIMHTPPVKVTPITPVNEAAQIMMDKGVGSLIIVDDNDNLIGIVTKTDIVREVVAKGLSRNVPVGNIMTKNPYFVLEDYTVKEAAELMGTHNIGHLPVLSRNNMKPVGMISKRDIIRLAPHYITLVYVLQSQVERR
jgi:CBS domain-containing protein